MARRHAPAAAPAEACSRRAFLALAGTAASLALWGCAGDEPGAGEGGDAQAGGGPAEAAPQESADDAAAAPDAREAAEAGPDPDELLARLDLVEDYRASFDHGEKGAEFQRYIVLHDTEGTGDAASVVAWWDSNGSGVAAHFVVNVDGSMVQCVPLDRIAHHAGFGDTGHNELFGVTDESRDDRVGTTEIGDWAQDYGMNSYSVGIELVHVGGQGDYPAEQLEALDDLVAYIDAYYGFESAIIDHKEWRTGNSDTSPEFAGYLANYKDHRTHD